ncbi:DUF6362 family protein [Rhizobium sp. NTR19]|uniref:DUF6362 family protein n=1 Tax=Neorhizobium turbinariae TaxID=2937795 RepID=A0ABT0IMG8_9HYPH|nr:DUF6362 family protein [Neorhizobium turbinariae]MCK8779067.1 DUF6362 family protein [Neorhizobium turbinariae]
MKFQDWTAQAVKDRVIEMAETLRRSPSVKGPRMFGNAMPVPVRRYDESYGHQAARYRESASAAALGRMEQVWRWVNDLPSEDDRKLLYAWSWVKVRKGLKISAFAAENDMNERTLLRSVTAICQAIADDLNQKGQFRLVTPDLQVSETQPDITSTTVSSGNCVTHWRASDAKPHIDPALPPVRVIEPRQARAR